MCAFHIYVLMSPCVYAQLKEFFFFFKIEDFFKIKNCNIFRIKRTNGHFIRKQFYKNFQLLSFILGYQLSWG